MADRALTYLPGDGQVLVVIERRVSAAGTHEQIRVIFTAVSDGRAARVDAERFDEEGLRAAGRSAARLAAGPRAWVCGGLPEQAAPAPSRDGADARLYACDFGELLGMVRFASSDGPQLDIEALASRIAVASSAGVRVSERRTHVRVSGPDGIDRVAGRPEDLDLASVVAARREETSMELDDATGLDGAPSVVLLAPAVARLLDRLRPAFGIDLALGSGPLAGRAGTRVAASSVNLSDSARYPGTLPRSFDAEGVARSPVPLIQDGVAHRAVHDTASAARAGGPATTTGHATQAATLAPLPEHLVLVGGGAEGVEELCAPLADGLLVRDLVPAALEGTSRQPAWALVGARRVRHGRAIGAIAEPLAIHLDALAALAAVEGLTARQQLIALPGHTPGGIGAAMVPALRIAAGAARIDR